MKNFMLFLVAMAIYTSSHAATITFLPATGLWNDPANWDLGVVPTAADDVIIPAGLRCLIPGGFNAFAQSVSVFGGGLFNQGNLEVIGSPGNGITLNSGRIDNRGSILVDNVGNDCFFITNGGRVKNRSNKTITLESNGDDGLHMDGNTLFLNLGILSVKGPNPDDGIYCDGIILVGPVGRIDVEDAGGNSYEFGGRFENYGTMTASNGIGNYGMQVSGPGISYNRSGGFIEIKEAGDEGFFLTDGVFINEAGATIDSYGSGQSSPFGSTLMVGNASGTTNPLFENYGTLLLHDILLGSGNGLHALTNGKIQNFNGGLIDIDNVAGNGIFSVNLGSSIENLTGGIITINTASQQGMAIGLNFLNEGEILIEGSGEAGIRLNSSGITFDNFGLITILDSGNAGVVPEDDALFLNAGTLVNHDCAIMDMDQNMEIGPFATMTNDGIIKTEGTNLNIGAFTNNGIIEDYNNTILSTFVPIVNNGVVVREVANPLSVGVPEPNILGLGSLAGFTTTLELYDDNTGSTSIGTYDPVANTFTPNAAGVGLTEGWIKISFNGLPCSDYYRIAIPAGISLTSDPMEKSLEDDLLSAQWQLFPNPSLGESVVRIPEVYQHVAVDLVLTDMLGRTIWQQQSIGQQQHFIRFGAGAAPGIYWLRATANGELLENIRLVYQP